MDDAPTEVRLIGYPVQLGSRQQEHLDELVREFMLLSMSRPELRERVPDRLLELVQTLTARYEDGLDAPRRVREQALHDGADTVDLVYRVPARAREDVVQWQSALQEVDAYCRNDDLLALATPPDLVALRDWIVSEFLAQLDGKQPTPWPGAAAG